MLKKGTTVLCDVVDARVPYGYPGRVLYIEKHHNKFYQGVWVAFDGVGVQRLDRYRIVLPNSAGWDTAIAYKKLEKNHFELPPFHRRLNVALCSLPYSPSDDLFAYDPQYSQYRNNDQLGIVCMFFGCTNTNPPSEKSYVVMQDGYGNFIAYNIADKKEEIAQIQEENIRRDAYFKKYHPDHWRERHKE